MSQYHQAGYISKVLLSDMTNRFDQLKSWLEDVLGHGGFDIKPASEDASFRRYYRVKYDDTTRIVMDAPPEHEDCSRFIDISSRLRNAGVNAPEVFEYNEQQGFVLLYDFGDVLYLDILDDANADKLYEDAMSALLNIQNKTDCSGIPAYDEALLLQEMDLFREWLLGRHLGIKLDTNQNSQLNKIYTLLKDNALQQPAVFVHRDFHSRNLMYCEKNNPGIIDFQDAVIGPVTYDLVSLFKDCYVKWPKEKVNKWVTGFYKRVHKDKYNEEKFIHWFDLMTAQRHLKTSGIFARLYHRDNKAGFLEDIPRSLSYILDLKNEYPELEFLISLIETEVIPGLVRLNN